MTIDLSPHVSKYVALKLSCGSIFYGKLCISPDETSAEAQNSRHISYHLREAHDYGANGIEFYLGYYLDAIVNFKKGKSKPLFKSYLISPEHVTVIRDISGDVEEAMQYHDKKKN